MKRHVVQGTNDALVALHDRVMESQELDDAISINDFIFEIAALVLNLDAEEAVCCFSTPTSESVVVLYVCMDYI